MEIRSNFTIIHVQKESKQATMVDSLFYLLLFGNLWLMARALSLSPVKATFSLHPQQVGVSAAGLVRNNSRFQLRKSYGKVSIQQEGGETVQISDSGLKISVKSSKISNWGTDPYAISCDGILGVYKLPAGSFLAIIKQADAFPDIPLPGLKVIKEIQLVKIPSVSNYHMHPDWVNETLINAEHALAEAALMNAFQQHTFYYTTSSYDLTRTFQSNTLHPSILESAKVNWTNIEEKYCWNMNAAAPFLEANCTSFITPVVNVYIATTSMTHNKKDYKFTLISRRSRRRQGPRYIKRGSDELGDMANFVETEQILQRADHSAVSSFVQIRGSIPLFWTQPADWKLRPPVFLQQHITTNNSSGDDSNNSASYDYQQASALKSHLCDLVNSYFTPLGGNLCGSTANGASTKSANKAKTKFDTVMSSHANSGGSSKIPEIHSSPLPKHSIYMINLIDKKGVQGKLGALWQSVICRINYASVKVFPRYGHFSSTMHSTSSNSISNSWDSTDSASSTTVSHTAQSTVPSESIDLNRDATTHYNTQLNITLPDLLTLQGERDPTGAVINDNVITGQTSTSNTTVPIDTHLVWFDYHHKCKRSCAAATLEIFRIVQSALSTGEGFSVFLNNQISGAGSGRTAGDSSNQSKTSQYMGNDAYSMKAIHTQKHIIRTNCMDCLDRTNVMQSIISRWVLARQLASLESVTAPPSNSDDQASLTAAQLKADQNKDFSLPDKKMENEFRRIWTENGDFLSVLYAGSRAMKRDVTRGGRRTQRGAMDDAVAGARRYFMNNLIDRQKQLGIDLLLGLGEYSALCGADAGIGSGKKNDEYGNGDNSSVKKSDNSDSSSRRTLYQYAPRFLRRARVMQILSSKIFAAAPDKSKAMSVSKAALSTITIGLANTIAPISSPETSSIVLYNTTQTLSAENVVPENVLFPDSGSNITISTNKTAQRLATRITGEVNSSVFTENAPRELTNGAHRIDVLLSEMLEEILNADSDSTPQVRQLKGVKKDKKKKATRDARRYHVNYLERATNPNTETIPEKKTLRRRFQCFLHSSYFKLILPLVLVFKVILN